MLLREIIKPFCRFYPLYSGCGTIANTSFFRFLSQTNEPVVITKLRDGSPIWARLDDYDGRTIYYFGDVDPKLTWVCRKVLRPGDTMVDIGANYGLVTIHSANLVGSTGCVHAFEPQPDLAELIQRSVKISGYEQVSVHNIALSSTDGILDMAIPAGHTGRASLSRQTAEATRKVQAQIRRASDYLSSLNLQTVRLLKLDVEGHEEEVLRGAMDFLVECKPDVIVFESNEYGKPFWERVPGRLLESIDYAIFEIPKVKFGLKLRELDRNTNPHPSSHDFVAVKRGQVYESLSPVLSQK